MLGFKTEDCITALANSDGKLDDAALWLTQNAVPTHSLKQEIKENNKAFIEIIEVGANFVFFYVFTGYFR